ncbi:uncharacterized protein [Physcomitrium patens]|uniref:Uncharacterized protein n=1 Tax=Physcomitrium patens TaxID=3218 RepID=A0A2K1JMZ4_PHYPA|nr:uncharacterized protein LOC112290158 [Physcomitrium patens]PNR42914.1 hypothetical protein PHYPA_017746 [Physcomitrium patens]|eukprot:XP_024391924.1 uncharacterized protein LOC112290158 [Physcomitrella patens]
MMGKKGVDLHPPDDFVLRPGLARRRLMVRRPENPFVAPHWKTDGRKHSDAYVKSPTIQDHLTNTPMTKSPKPLRLFDLNKLPTAPTWITGSTDSKPHALSDESTAMTTRSRNFMENTDLFFISPRQEVRLTEDKDDERGARLSVDLGPLRTSRASKDLRLDGNCWLETRDDGHKVDIRSPDFPEKPCHADYGFAIPTWKRLKKLTECKGGHTHVQMSTDNKAVDKQPYVTKTLPPSLQCEAKEHWKDVSGAICALLMLSGAKGKRDLSNFLSDKFCEPEVRQDSPKSIPKSYSETKLYEEDARQCSAPSPAGTELTGDSDASDGSWGSASVLVRPSNKHRYRSMAELMAET